MSTESLALSEVEWVDTSLTIAKHYEPRRSAILRRTGS